MAFPSNVNCVALLAGPFLCLKLSIGLLNLRLIHNDHMVRNSMRLVT
jgi:hypothetical protein